ncbi:EcsC family protein [Schlesneria sp. T3-172]|uniref:EcsC family protein n=1 Tax=Schlesneria sphaerica TaxID=3373610 RepID=UPI0037C6459A
MISSGYDKQAITAIHKWKNPDVGWFSRALTTLNWPLSKAGDMLLSTPGLGDAIKHAVQGAVGVCNDLAHWSVPKDWIYNEFRKQGHEVRDARDVLKLELEEIDKLVGWLDAKYRALAAVEGAGAGAVGLPGIPADIVALLMLNLRAIGEYATYYGFDLTLPQERLFAMNILGLASSSNAAAKQMAMAQLVKIAKDVASKRTWEHLNQHAFVQVVQQISKALGIRLTKDKLAQVIPVTGAAIGGGFNAYFTSNVCSAAYFLYRERFLAEKYGSSVIEETVEPAEAFDPRYPEGDELT